MMGTPASIVALLAAALFIETSVKSQAADPATCNESAFEWQVDRKTDWTGPEKCTWVKISKGEVATFNKDEKDRESRTLRGKFIKEILATGELSKQIPVTGVQIEGAIIKEVKLDNIEIEKRLRFADCEFEGEATFIFVKPKQPIDFSGSRIVENEEFAQGKTGILNLAGMASESTLFLRGTVADVSIRLEGVRIKENVDLRSANTPLISARQLQIGGDILLDRAMIETLDFDEAKINGRIKAISSHFNSFSIQKAQIGSVLLNRVDGRYDSEPSATIILNGSTVDRDFEIVAGYFEQIIASNMSVYGKLSFTNSAESPAKCAGECKLSLYNSFVAGLELDESILPARINAIGLTYKSFKLFDGDGGQIFPTASEENLGKYLKWLRGADNSSINRTLHSPQAYRQLAQIWKTAGYDEEAKRVYYEEREAARRRADWLGAVWEWTKWLVIGYGYQMWRACVGVFIFLMIGWYVVHLSHIGKQKRFGLAYSFDRLLPVIQLREEHKTDLEPPFRYYFYVHRVIGYILALFLIAALSGLTKTD